MQHHMANADMEQLVKLLLASGEPLSPPPETPADVNERFRLWMTQGSFDWEADGFPHWSHFHHAQTFWNYRHLPNIHFLHYADLKADLAGQMRRVADALGVIIDEAKWPALVKAATFDEMKSNADRTAPNTNQSIWVSNREFFHKGVNAQWRGVLSEANLKLYDEVKRKRYDPTLVDWLERGSAAAGDPKDL